MLVKSLNKTKVFKIDREKHTGGLQRMKNTYLKTTPIKTGKKLVTTYCLGCKDYIHNFKPQEVKMTNKAALFVNQANQDF